MPVKLNCFLYFLIFITAPLVKSFSQGNELDTFGVYKNKVDSLANRIEKESTNFAGKPFSGISKLGEFSGIYYLNGREISKVVYEFNLNGILKKRIFYYSEGKLVMIKSPENILYYYKEILVNEHGLTIDSSSSKSLIDFSYEFLGVLYNLAKPEISNQN